MKEKKKKRPGGAMPFGIRNTGKSSGRKQGQAVIRPLCGKERSRTDISPDKDLDEQDRQC